MTRPLLPVFALLSLALAACSQQGAVVPERPVAGSPVDSAAGVTLRLPAPAALSAQYVSARTTRIDVGVDDAPALRFVLGSPQAPCQGGFCTVTLPNLSPAGHTFTVSSYAALSGADVLVSRGSVTQRLAPGRNDIALTLFPVNVRFTLSSAVRQFDPQLGAFGNYVRFTVLGGRGLPAYYAVQAADSLGDPLPDTGAVLCGDSGVIVTSLADAAHPARFRVEVQTPGPHLLSVQAGSCSQAGFVLASLPVSGSAPTAGQGVLGAGASHSLALLSDGTVRAWGDNGLGQTAGGSAAASVPGLSGVVSVSAGRYHSLAVLKGGTVRAWGFDGFAQTADGSVGNDVSGLGGVVAVSAGASHSLALLSDGTVRAWGDNSAGQTAGGSSTASIPGLGSVVSVSAASHNLALLSDGTVRAWGENGSGQTGGGTVTSSIAGLSDVVAVSAGDTHSLALLADGTVRAWGSDADGESAGGSVTLGVTGLSGVAGVSAGSSHSLALMNDGTVRAWGYDAYGQLGGGSVVRAVPVLSGAVSVSAGAFHNLALLGDGTVRAWGYNGFAQTADGTAARSIGTLGGVRLPVP